MSSNQPRGKPGLQYAEDIHKESVPVQKAFKMTVDNLFYLHRQVTELLEGGISATTAQQIINQTVNQISSGGGGGGGGGGGASIVVHVSTHAVRVVSYSSATDPVGSIFFETDRCSIYYISNASGVSKWIFAAGMMTGAIVTRPADLGTDDAGFAFVATDTTEQTQYVWSGATWYTTGGLREVITDAVTAASSNVFRMAHRSSGVPAANFGAIARTELDNAANTLTDASALDTFWTASTAAAETAAWAIQLKVLGAALSDYFQLLFNGIRFKVGSFWGKFTHANSADRTYTMPDADGNITYETAVLTNNNFLFGGGGALVKDAGFSDVPYANFVQATAASKLVGRGSASGAGDMQEITVGTGLSMSGTTLSTAAIGGLWTLFINEDGTSLTNWTSVLGTWTVVSSAFHVVCGALAFGHLRFTSRVPQSSFVFEADVKIESGGGFAADNRVGLRFQCDGGTGTNGGVVFLRCSGALNPATTGGIYSENPFGSVAGAQLANVFNLDTYYTLRCVVSGNVIDIYFNGTFITSRYLVPNATPAAAIEVSAITLTAYNCNADYKNIKMYTIVLP